MSDKVEYTADGALCGEGLITPRALCEMTVFWLRYAAKEDWPIKDGRGNRIHRRAHLKRMISDLEQVLKQMPFDDTAYEREFMRKRRARLD